MKIIEPHIHCISRTTDDYQAMYGSGIRVCVEPSFWMGCDRRYAGSFWDYFNLILEFETVRAARFGMDHYAAIGFNPKEAENAGLVDEVLDGIAPYLDHPRCVALGEIGLNNNTDNEIKAFRRQLIMAEERRMPVIIHLPHGPKYEGAKIIVDIIKAEGVTRQRILIDHNDEDSIGITAETGCFTGLTVYPYSKLDPGRVSAIISRYGADRMLVAGSADWGVSDPVALPGTLACLHERGCDDELILKLARENADMFYGHSPNWSPDFGIEPVPVSDYQR